MNNSRSVSVYEVAGYLRAAKQAILANEYPAELREQLFRRLLLGACDMLDSALAKREARGD